MPPPVLCVLAGARHQGTSPSPLGQQPVESAATQIVHKALRFITDQAPSPPPPGAADPAANMKPSFDSHTFLDKVSDGAGGTVSMHTTCMWAVWRLWLPKV